MESRRIGPGLAGRLEVWGVTELLEGETLGQVVSQRVPTLSQILSHMLQAARGLEAAHARGIVHRDIKPENLFLTTEGRVMVLDSGLAKVVDQEPETGSAASTAARLTAPGQVAGTILYMSPEQARAQALDPRSDVSSFGVVVYEFLAGRHPFRKGTVAATLTAIIEDMPPDLVSSPDDRFLFGGGIGPPFAAPLDGSPARLLEKPSADRVPGCSHQPALRRRGHPLHRRHGCSGRTRSDARASGSSI